MRKSLISRSFLLLCAMTALLFVAVLAPDEAWAKSSRSARHPKVTVVTAQQVPSSADEIVIADAIALSPHDMEETRAGFIDPTGYLVKFAVDVKTQIDGALTFVRSMVLQPDASGQFQTTASSQVMPQNLPEGTTARITANGTGAVVTSSQGITTVLTQGANGSIANIIFNTANNRDITQTMNLDLVLRNVNAALGPIGLHNLNAPAGLNQGAHMHTLGFGL